MTFINYRVHSKDENSLKKGHQSWLELLTKNFLSLFFHTEGLSSTMSTMPSLTSQKSTDNGTGIDESTKAASKAASKGASMTASTVASMASRQEVFHTLVASHESHHPLQLNKESR